MAKPAKKSKNSNIIEVNFEGVKSFKSAPEGNHKVTVTEVTQSMSSNDNPMLSWVYEVTEGKAKGAKLWDVTSLQPQALFRLREVLVALGLEVPDDVMELNLEDMVGLTCGVVVGMEEYQGKKRARITDYIGEDDVNESGEEDAEEAPAKSKRASKKDTSDDADEEVADVSKMDEDELAELVAEQGLDVDLEDFGSLKKKRTAVEEAMSSTTEGADEDDTEKFSEDTINEMGLEGLEQLNDDLKLKIKGFDELSKKDARKAVLKALAKAGLIED